MSPAGYTYTEDLSLAISGDSGDGRCAELSLLEIALERTPENRFEIGSDLADIGAHVSEILKCRQPQLG